ncbi:SDR family oxidoreductase [Vibrio sp.]|nr:SDR family oxidoreductase [Vibrio sp.]
MQFSFNGKNCLIVGASSGIGLEIAKEFRNLNANVFIASANKAKLQASYETLSLIENQGHLFQLPVDISESEGIKSLVNQAALAMGSIDILVNCAGVSISKTMDKLTVNDWDSVLNINLKAAYLLATQVAQTMVNSGIEHGKIINISSIAGKVGEYGNGPYSISKAGINSLTQVLAKELGSHGICVTAVSPGFTDTQLLRDALSSRAPLEGKTPTEYIEELKSTVALKRFAEPKEIAYAVVFLCSRYANYISGTTLTIDGGKSLT